MEVPLEDKNHICSQVQPATVEEEVQVNLGEPGIHQIVQYSTTEQPAPDLFVRSFKPL